MKLFNSKTTVAASIFSLALLLACGRLEKTDSREVTQPFPAEISARDKVELKNIYGDEEFGIDADNLESVEKALPQNLQREGKKLVHLLKNYVEVVDIYLLKYSEPFGLKTSSGTIDQKQIDAEFLSMLEKKVAAIKALISELENPTSPLKK